MTVREFVALVQDRPDLLDLRLAHSPMHGALPPYEAHQVYIDISANGHRCVCISGGGYPSRLTRADYVTADQC